MAKGINIDFKEIQYKLNKLIGDIVYYFKHLSTDMIIAWSVLGVGLILVIVGLIII
jgi:hypothetical protein